MASAVAPPSSPRPVPVVRAEALPQATRSAPMRRWLPLLVFLIAVALAGNLYARFREDSRHLWFSSTHDRNAHYLFGLRLATDVRQGRLGRFLEDLNSAAVWPPLHGLLAAGVLLAGGLDYRLAVLPSLAGWVGAVLFAFLVARRVAPCGGNVAGLAAALFVVASPSHRAFATDVMLESLGACLTLAVLHAYLIAVQSPSIRGFTPPARQAQAGRRLGLALTLLFLLKYNYWLLAALALLAAEAAARPPAFGNILAALSGGDWRRRVRAQLHRPLNYVFLALLLLCVAVHCHGDRPIRLFGHSVSLYPPHNLLTVAYVVFFVRLVRWWRASGRAWAAGLDGRLRQVVLWHGWPVAVWFLLPRRLSSFLWYVSPADANPTDRIDLVAGARHYLPALLRDYHLGPAHALVAAFLAGAGLLALARPGRARAGVVAWLLSLAAVLTVVHPNHKERYLHTWVAAAWVLAGVGLAALVHGLTERRRRLRPWLGIGALAALAAASLAGFLRPAWAVEGGVHPERPSLLDLTDSFRADLDGARRATVLACVPVKPLVQWTYLERHGHLGGLEENWFGFGPPGPANREGFRRWLGTTDCDTLVFLEDLKQPTPWPWEPVPECRLYEELRDLLPAQTRFRLIKARTFPHHGCRVLVWRREGNEPRMNTDKHR